MRCYCCNKNLSDYESTLRSETTGEYLDMCRACLKDSGIRTMPNSRDPAEPAPQDWDDFNEDNDDFIEED